MLKAIWPSIVHFPNHLPKSASITSVGTLDKPCSLVAIDRIQILGLFCYLLFWLVQFPFMLITPQNIRYLFFAKALIVPLTFIAILVWSMMKVPTSRSLNLNASSTLNSSDLCWAWLRSLNSTLGSWMTLAVNIPDFTVSILLLRSSRLTFMLTNLALCYQRKSVRIFFSEYFFVS